MRPYALLAATGLALAALAGCSKDEPASEAVVEAATDTPSEAVEAAAAALRKGDLLGMVRLTMPPAEYERMKADWTAARATPADADDEAKYAEMMSRLAAPGAEDQIYAELEPKLAQFEAETAAQLPMMIGMMQGFAAQGIASNEKLTEEQKRQATQAVNATASWLQTVPWADREKLKQAIGRAVATARSLELPTLQAMRALEFEQAMQKAGVAFQGVKDILAVYGFPLDALLESVRAEQVAQVGDNANVKVSFKLFETELSHEVELSRENGRWYGKDALAKINAARAELEAAP